MAEAQWRCSGAGNTGPRLFSMVSNANEQERSSMRNLSDMTGRALLVAGGFGAAATQASGFGGFGGGGAFGSSAPTASSGNSSMWQMRK